MSNDDDAARPPLDDERDVRLIADLCDAGDLEPRLLAILRRDDFDKLAVELLHDAN